MDLAAQVGRNDRSPPNPNLYRTEVRVQDPDNGKQIFLLELECIQCLANCTYINCNKKRKEMHHTHLGIPDDMDMIPLQSMSSLTVLALEMNAPTRAPPVPLLFAN